MNNFFDKISNQRLHYVYLVGLAAFHLLIAATLLPMDDEMYYWVWSKNLDWGYFDHPPMVALFIAISSFLAKGFLGIRLLTIVSLLLTLLIWKAILKPITKAEIHIFYWSYLSIVCFQIYGLITTPDVPLLLFGSLYLYLFKRCLNSDKSLNFLGLAMAMALVMYSKYMGILLIGFSLLAIFKKQYKNLRWSAAIFLSIIFYLPALIWQQDHDWVSVKYHLTDRVRQDYFSFENMLNYLLGFLSMSGILMLTIPISKYKSGFKNEFKRALIFIAVGTFLFFFLNSFTKHTQAQWNLIIYLAIFGLMFPVLVQYGIKNWRFKLAVFSSVFMMILSVVFCFPNIPTPMSKLKNFVFEANEVADNIPVFERYQQTAAFQYYIGEPTYCYRVYNHRASQYDLWDDEAQMQHQNLSFFNLEKLGRDSLKDNYNKWEFYSDYQDFVSFPKVEFVNITNIYSAANETLNLTFTIDNPYSKNIDLKNDHQTIILIGFNREGHPNWVYELIDSGKIPAESSEIIKIQKKITLPAEMVKYAIGMRPIGASGKMQSDYFEIIDSSNIKSE